MLADTLARLRPLFLVALVLCWNATSLALSGRLGEPVSKLALVLLACAALTLGMLCVFVRRAAWARALVLRPEAEYHQVSGAMFFIGSLSLFQAAWLLVAVWERS